MAGLISEVIGGNVDSDLDKLVAKLAAVEKELDVINGKAITIKVDLQGVGTLSELTSLYKQQDEILTKLRSTSVQYVDTYKMATEVIKQHNGQTLKVVEVSKRLADNMLTEAKTRRENVKTLIDEVKYTDALEKKKEELEKKTEKARIAAEKESNAYLQLRKTYNEQSTALKGMIIQYGEADAAVVKMKADVDKMYTSLLKAEQAVGQHQRQVGQYQNATFAMSQLLREAPSFAYSMSTGFLALSNNIPILVDQITALKEANEKLKASGQATIPVWKTLMGAITSPAGLITIAVAAITLFSARWKGASDNMTEAEKSANKLKDTISELSDKTIKGYIEELNASQDLFESAQDLGLTYDARVAAIEKLIQLYPELLSNMDNEAMMSDKMVEKQNLISQILSKREYIKYYKGIVDEITKTRNELEKQFADKNKAGGFYNPFSDEGTTKAIKEHQAQIQKLNNDIADAAKMAKILQDELKYIMNPKHEGRILSDIDADIREQQRKRDNNAIDKKEHIEAIARLKELDEERRKFLGMDKDKKKKDTISDELADAKADYEIQLQLNRQKFLNSRQTYTEEEQLNRDNLQATKDYGERYVLIVEDYNKRVGLSEEEHTKHLKEAHKLLLEGLNKAKEAEDKIQEEIIKKHIQANEQMQKYIEGLSKQRQELEKINREIDAIQDKAASRKEYAESFAPYLEGFGFNTAFGQQVKQKNLDIEAQRSKVDLASEAEANEGVKGSMADAIKLGQLRIKTAEETKSLQQMEADRDEMYNQKMIEGKKELARKTVELAQQAFEAINTIRNNAFAAEQKQLEIQSQNLKLRTDQEMRAIDAKAGFEASKANEKSKLAAETAAKENEIRAKSNELALRQARANKQAAQVSIITNTAASIIKAFVDFPYPVAIPIAAALAATGAVQYSVASSAPLPQYAKGTEGTTQERFIAGEKGAELGITPSGKTMLFEKEGIYSAPLGTKIKTADQTKKLMQYAINGIGYNGESLNALNQNMHISLDDKKIVDTIKEQTHDIAVTLWKTKGNNNSSTQQAYIDAVREQQNLISKFK